jgi:dTDP-4-amino-4,6-dideoxygalactose transaminase
VTEQICRQRLSLPLFPEMTDEQQDATVEALADTVRAMDYV